MTVLGRDVYVTALTIEDQAKASAMYPDGGAMRQAAFLAMGCKDANGKPLFTVDDHEALAKRVGAGRFAAVWAVINGESVDAQAEK